MKARILGSIASLVLAMAVPVNAQKSAGNVVDDNTVNASVKAALIDDKDTSASSINVETYKGHVQLSGFVTTDVEKEAATTVAKRVSGVVTVYNDIGVHPSTSAGTKLDDTVLVSKVKAALIDASDVKSGQINVEARGGVVQLAGFVSGEKMKQAAEAAATRIQGVKKIENVLRVKPQ
jgi:osmotically-inducible protein OsmY